MLIQAMAIKNRNKQVEVFKIKNKDGETFKDKFVRIHFMSELDRKMVEELATSKLVDKKAFFFELDVPENTNVEGEKANSYWTSKKTDKYNERFFIVRLTENTLLPF